MVGNPDGISVVDPPVGSSEASKSQEGPTEGVPEGTSLGLNDSSSLPISGKLFCELLGPAVGEMVGESRAGMLVGRPVGSVDGISEDGASVGCDGLLVGEISALPVV